MSSPNSRYSLSTPGLSLQEKLRVIQERANRRSREQLDLARRLASTASTFRAIRDKRYHDMYYAGIMNQCRDEDVQICDDTLSALEARAEGDLSTHAARSGLLKDLLEVVQPRTPMHPSRAPLDGLNTVRGNNEREESLEIHPWNMEEYGEEDDKWDGGYWVHEDEHMSDFMDEHEEEYDEDEDENEESDYDEDYPDDFRGHGGHGQDLEDSLMGRRLGTPPTNDFG